MCDLELPCCSTATYWFFLAQQLLSIDQLLYAKEHWLFKDCTKEQFQNSQICRKMQPSLFWKHYHYFGSTPFMNNICRSTLSWKQSKSRFLICFGFIGINPCFVTLHDVVHMFWDTGDNLFYVFLAPFHMSVLFS